MSETSRTKADWTIFECMCGGVREREFTETLQVLEVPCCQKHLIRVAEAAEVAKT